MVTAVHAKRRLLAGTSSASQHLQLGETLPHPNQPFLVRGVNRQKDADLELAWRVPPHPQRGAGWRAMRQREKKWSLLFSWAVDGSSLVVASQRS